MTDKTLTIEDKIHEMLDGDLNERALKFINYLHANQLTPQQWYGANL